MLEAIGKREVKVYAGAAKPIVRDAVHAVDIHGNCRGGTFPKLTDISQVKVD